jgi:6-phosphogluconolactonase
MKSRIFLVLVASLSLLLIPTLSRADDMYVYFGTHARGPGKGFSLSHFDMETGALSKPQYLVDAVEPAYFVIHPDGRHLYTCNGGEPGAVSAYEINPAHGQIKLLNQKPAGGADPSYITLDRTNRFLLVANYVGGNISALAVQPDGSLGERTALIQHTGKSINSQRQSKPFAHSIVLDPTNGFALVADLGVDKLFVYRFNEKDGTLAPNDPPSASVKPGSGPRHVRFHPNGKWVYLINEMGCTIIGFNWDSTRGSLDEFQMVPTLPEGFSGTSTCAEVDIHPNGKFLYGTNRGHDSVAVFSIDQASGKLSLIEHAPSGGKTPRNFSFDPSGQWMICTNHGSNNAAVFRIDQATGKLTQVGQPVEVPYPFCPRFLPVPKP